MMFQIQQEQVEEVFRDFQNTSSGTMDYKILTSELILIEMNNIIDEIREMIPLSRANLIILLNYMKWDKENLLEKYFEDDRMLLKKANVIIPTHQTYTPDLIKKPMVCEICYNEDELPEETSGMSCGHRFCKTCWTSYLHGKIMDEGTSLNIKCPGFECPIFVEYEMVKEYIIEEPIIQKYQQLIAKIFVDSNQHLRWCPRAGCNNAVKVNDPKWSSVTCSCEKTFCFSCGQDSHEPLKCEILCWWLRNFNEDFETAHWMYLNTKNCPKCNTLIEKNGGCNIMICLAKSCRHQFCWLCLKNWNTHTMGMYTCNQFNEATTSQNIGQVQDSLKRYHYYYERYVSHMRSLEFEAKLKNTINEKMTRFQEVYKMSWVDVQFFKTATNILCDCRKTLMYTYCFAFFLTKSNQSELFQENQKDLELATENLSRYLENDTIEDEDDAKGFDPNDMKTKIINISAYCASRRSILVLHVLEGYEEDKWTYRDEPIFQCNNTSPRL